MALNNTLDGATAPGVADLSFGNSALARHTRRSSPLLCLRGIRSPCASHIVRASHPPKCIAIAAQICVSPPPLRVRRRALLYTLAGVGGLPSCAHQWPFATRCTDRSLSSSDPLARYNDGHIPIGRGDPSTFGPIHRRFIAGFSACARNTSTA